MTGVHLSTTPKSVNHYSALRLVACIVVDIADARGLVLARLGRLGRRAYPDVGGSPSSLGGQAWRKRALCGGRPAIPTLAV